MTNLKAILQPAYEPGDGKADGAQLVDVEWWHPIFGCDSLPKVVDNVRSMLQLPPNYIDPEHQGQDRELLQAFYQVCSAEGGTADEIHLKGIKAALATLQTALPVPSAPNEECFTALRDEILNLHDGLDVNEMLHIIDNHTPKWV
jgi:GNAT superfamily N-acetyltransferase